jgi:hypothetical protein
MQYDPRQIAALITEDPDLILEWDPRTGELVRSVSNDIKSQARDPKYLRTTNYYRLLHEVLKDNIGMVPPEDEDFFFLELSHRLGLPEADVRFYAKNPPGESAIQARKRTRLGWDELKPGILANDPIEQHLDLSVRAGNVLAQMGVKTMGQLVNLSPDEILNQRNMGGTAMKHLEKELGEKGLKFKGKSINTSPQSRDLGYKNPASTDQEIRDISASLAERM